MKKLEKIRTLVGRTMRFGALTPLCLGMLAIGAGSVAGFFSDLCTPCELLSHFRVVYVCLFAGLLVAFLVLRCRWAAVIAGALLVINILPVAYLYVPSTVVSAETAPEAKFKVMQINLQGGRNKQFERAIAAVKREDPDLVGLSEITVGWADYLERNLGSYPYRVVYPHVGGVSLFSKFPIKQSEVRHFGKFKRPRLVAQIDFPGQPVDVVFIHPVTPNKSRSQRNGELSVVASEAKAFKNPGIVFGDMNTTPWSACFEHLLNKGGLVDSERGFGFQPTWNAKMRLSLLPIDHLLVTPQFAVRDRRVLKRVGSDHLPVVVELALQKS